MLKQHLNLLVLSLVTCISGASQAKDELPTQIQIHYADMAYLIYSDSLATARNLQAAVNDFVTIPSLESLENAKSAWKKACVPYGQTEVFRFGNANVDDWEGQVNAWPLDEGLIDYVEIESYEHEEGNEFSNANIIAGTEEINVNLLHKFT